MSIQPGLFLRDVALEPHSTQAAILEPIDQLASMKPGSSLPESSLELPAVKPSRGKCGSRRYRASQLPSSLSSQVSSSPSTVGVPDDTRMADGKLG